MKRTLIIIAALTLLLTACSKKPQPQPQQPVDPDTEGMGWAGIEVVESSRQEVLRMFPDLYHFNIIYDERDEDKYLNYCKTSPQKGIFVSGRTYWIQLYIVNMGYSNINTEEKLYSVVEENFDSEIRTYDQFLYIPENERDFPDYLASQNQEALKKIIEEFGTGEPSGGINLFNGPVLENARMIFNDDELVAVLRWFQNGIVVYLTGNLHDFTVENLYRFISATDYLARVRDNPDWN
ncbi:MAG: hypothetical protein II126_04455 [Erysipelotrichaceae bacterium]|nr:hypothetical protein [Erysipelotrichaceae bacterium]